MEFIIGIVLYVSGGFYFMPKFAKEQFKIQKARWSWQSDTVSKSEAVGIAWGKSLIWPIFAIMHYAMWHLNAEDRQKEEEAQANKDLERAERIVALHQAKQKLLTSHEETKWLKAFNQLDKELS